METKQHWDAIYASKATEALGWYQPHAERSLQLIQASGIALAAPLIDVGGGASTLADDLLRQGYSAVAVLDLSEHALAKTKLRLGEAAQRITWLEGDITQLKLPKHHYELWHDRAVFHFLTKPQERSAYLAQLQHALKANGHLIIATFAEDGPERCSGLPVVRYSPTTLLAELGAEFELLEHHHELHQTPFGTTQKFLYCHLRKRG